MAEFLRQAYHAQWPLGILRTPSPCGRGIDTHGAGVGDTANFPSLKNRLLPPLDLALSALLDDLAVAGGKCGAWVAVALLSGRSFPSRTSSETSSLKAGN
jgi:hypothetical protein